MQPRGPLEAESPASKDVCKFLCVETLSRQLCLERHSKRSCLCWERMLGQEPGCWPHLTFRSDVCVRITRCRHRSLVRPDQPLPRPDGCQGHCCPAF